jgi:SAM-dependent methyltransferase
MTLLQPAQIDVLHLQALRANVEALTRRAATDFIHVGDRVLDVAPQDHGGIAPFVADGVVVETLDIDPDANSTYVADICARNESIPDGLFDHVICTEVLEHTLQPFNAAAELLRVLKPGGHLFVSTPFGFRIHGPLPDCWRFTEHGLRALLSAFDILELKALDDVDRPLMPIHYTVIARRPELICPPSSSDRELGELGGASDSSQRSRSIPPR